MSRFSSFVPTMAATLASALFIAPVEAQPVSPYVLTSAESNCLTAVAEVVGRPLDSLKVIQHTSDASEISIDLKVPKATGPWACLTDLQGKVKDTYFKGSEGAR